jgi:hypothetical protein
MPPFRTERRMTLMKAILGLALGIALMSALQTVGVWSLQEHIKSQSNAGLPIGNTPVVGNFDADALKNGILPKFGPIDTSEGQRLAIEGGAPHRPAEPRRSEISPAVGQVSSSTGSPLSRG